MYSNIVAVCVLCVYSVYCVCTVCVLCVYCVCAVCVLCVYCVCTVCVLSVSTPTQFGDTYNCDEYGFLYKDLVALGSDGTGLVTGYRVSSEKLYKAANIHNIILSSPCHGEQFLHYLQSEAMFEVQKMLDQTVPYRLSYVSSITWNCPCDTCSCSLMGQVLVCAF